MTFLQNTSLQQPVQQSQSGLSLLQSALQQSVNQETGVPPPVSTAANPNIALQQALSALQPLLLQSGAAHPTLGLPGGAQPTMGLPNLPINQMFQAPPTVPVLPIQQFLPGLTQSPYQPSPSTTVFVLPQPQAAQAQPAAETSHNRHQHKNCCPGCLAEIQELKRLVDLIIRANANTITPATNISPLLLQQQLQQVTPSLLQQQLQQATPPLLQQHLQQTTPSLVQQQLQQATSALSSTPLPVSPGVQRLIQNPAVFNAASTPGVSTPIPDNKSWNQPPSLSSDAIQKRTGLHPGSHSDWQDNDDGLDLEPIDDKSLPTSTTSASSKLDDLSQPGPSHDNNPSFHDNNPSFHDEPLWKSKRGKNTMEQIQSRLEPDPLNPSQYVVKEEVLYMLKQKSDDRQFIARRLANLLFTKQERRISNCHGRRHKRPLDPVRLDAIKRAVFKINPMVPDNSVTRDIAWKQCCASIDMSSRSACRNIKQPEEV